MNLEYLIGISNDSTEDSSGPSLSSRKGPLNLTQPNPMQRCKLTTYSHQIWPSKDRTEHIK
jgi:hypothetical protein